ncbi:hypothetical protein SAMN04488598_13215 [Halanaerobium congolense]|jgi:glycosyltransferase involved in cell wall biosynthesis|uniref:Glycosyl transferase family 2 n=1 Tax=Halanaerobium congolense TaxID=54121 RepID=A0A1I0C8G5_9FIRM|nr:hypothetical protein SAMN04488598_13215 [Halanaerobium congolense]SET15824.1 hypothetical protein SAMN04515652_13215 [Halanaerobium congolense]SFP61864.1 hypothetical protein SAMN04488596_13315 [Halanaerobium congolense]
MEFELSVIIPTLNEEKNIGSLIDFIDQEKKYKSWATHFFK